MQYVLRRISFLTKGIFKEFEYGTFTYSPHTTQNFDHRFPQPSHQSVGVFISLYHNFDYNRKTAIRSFLYRYSSYFVLDHYRAISMSEREKGTYFKLLIKEYLTVEPAYADLYTTVWMYAAWAREQGIDARDTGIDLVAQTFDGDLHAIQCKLYAPDYTLQKADIDSFFTASGKKPFVRRIIVSTTNRWSVHAQAALVDQQPPVTKIDQKTLQDSVIDWSRYERGKRQSGNRKKSSVHIKLAL